MSLRALFHVEQTYSYAILRPLQQELLARGGAVRWFFVGNEVSDDYLSEDEAALYSVEAVKDWNPDVVLIPGNVVSSVIPGLKVCVFHGFDAGKIDSKGSEAHYAIRGCFDLYCTQGPSVTGKFKQLAEKHGHFDVMETGWPAVDPLFLPTLENPYTNSEDPRKTILYCSTFSRKYSSTELLYEKIKAFSESGEHRWLIQFHPKMPTTIVEKYKSLQNDNLRFVETDNVIPLLQAADMMLCDTSSILLMFLLLRKPVVTFRNQNPGAYLLDVEHVEDLNAGINTALKRPAHLLDAIDAYRQQMHPYSDGKSSGRVIDAVEEALRENKKLPRSKPLNLIREFKQRKKLGYWGL